LLFLPIKIFELFGLPLIVLIHEVYFIGLQLLIVQWILFSIENWYLCTLGKRRDLRFKFTSYLFNCRFLLNLTCIRFMIKNLIFDFGGVVIDIEPYKVGQSFTEMGVKHVDKVHESAVMRGLYLDYEKGLITSAEFRDGLREVSGLKLADEQIDKAWNSMIVRFPGTRFELVRQLKENYNVYLLSNTNEIHYQYFNKCMREHFGANRLEDFFTQCFYSHQMKMRKPDPEIFLKMIETAHIKPGECLYIDDLPENIEAARELGIHGIVHHPGEEINQYFVEGRIRD